MPKPISTTGTGTVTSVTDFSTFNPLLEEKGINLTYAIEITSDDGGGTLTAETHTSPEVGVGDKVNFTISRGAQRTEVTGVTKIP